VDIIVAGAPPAPEAAQRATSTIPIVMLNHNDPVGSGLVATLPRPGGNVTGVTDTPPLTEQLNFIETCVPKLKTLGVVYNPGEANSVTMLNALKPLAKKKNIKILTASASKSAVIKYGFINIFLIYLGFT
jgi:putative ABC transport system substrate-binding protein